jgi:hypothetical protein
MSALPTPAGLKYFDNSNNTPAPYGVQVPFNQENQDVWIGYDTATGQLCITNFNRTQVITCFFGSSVNAYGNFVIPSKMGFALNTPETQYPIIMDVANAKNLEEDGADGIRVLVGGKYRLVTEFDVNFNLVYGGVSNNAGVIPPTMTIKRNGTPALLSFQFVNWKPKVINDIDNPLVIQSDGDVDRFLQLQAGDILTCFFKCDMSLDPVYGIDSLIVASGFPRFNLELIDPS